MESGSSSSISRQILGFDSDGNVTNNCGDDWQGGGLHSGSGGSWEEIVSDSTKVISFLDLAGHEDYLKTTVFGLAANVPDYSMVVVAADQVCAVLVCLSICVSLCV